MKTETPFKLSEEIQPIFHSYFEIRILNIKNFPKFYNLNTKVNWRQETGNLAGKSKKKIVKVVKSK